MGAAILSSVFLGHFYLGVLAMQQDFYALAGVKLCARRCHRGHFCSNLQLGSGLLRCEQPIVTDSGSNTSRLKLLHVSRRYVPYEHCERNNSSTTEKYEKPATDSDASPSAIVGTGVKKSLMLHPNDTRPGRRQTHSAIRNAVHADESKQVTALFDATKYNTIHPDTTTTPDMFHSDRRKPNTIHTDATKQDAAVSEPSIDTIHLQLHATTPNTIQLSETTPNTIQLSETTPNTIQLSETTPNTIQLSETTPNTIQLDATTPNAIQLDATTPNTVHPDVTRRVTILTDRTKQDTGYFDATASHTISPDQTRSETIHTDETRLNNTHPESTEPDTTRPDTIRTSTIQPDPVYSNKNILKSMNNDSITSKRLYSTKTTLNPPYVRVITTNTPQIVETTMTPFHSDVKNVREDPTCVDSVCRCEVGMSYDPKRNKCVKVCQKYGKTMSIYRGHYINDHNDYPKSWKGISLRGCIHKCVSLKKFLCKSFDYGKAIGINLPFLKKGCYLSKVGYFDVPSEMRKTLKIYTLGVRNCEP